MSHPFKIGDPVMDAAQGRAMVVVATPDLSVEEWSEQNDYDLTENYANAKFHASHGEAVVECVYVSDVRSEPSKTYTFPVSRCRLIDVHHADEGRRLADRVTVEILEALFAMAMTVDEEWAVEPSGFEDAINKLVANAGAIDESVADEARELADVERTIGGDDA